MLAGGVGADRGPNGVIAALEWLLVGATERRLQVGAARGGCRVAAAVSLCRPRWLMDRTGADEHVAASLLTTRDD